MVRPDSVAYESRAAPIEKGRMAAMVSNAMGTRKMMGHRQKLISGDEVDALSRMWRKMLIYLERPGVRKAIKRKVNKRSRREAKGALMAAE